MPESFAIHYPTLLTATGGDKGRDVNSLIELDSNPTRRTYQMLGTPTTSPATVSVTSQTLGINVNVSGGTKSLQQFRKISLILQPSFTYTSATGVEHTGKVTLRREVIVPVYDVIDETAFTNMWQNDPNWYGATIVADAVDLPYMLWFQGLPILNGAK